jgi:NAD(P)-dependent dehydrogenase (short-subunit alcohol dehydrogenase family)
MELQQGLVAVVTGGASGLGLAMARAFGARGLSVVIADVEPGALDEAARSLEADGVAVLGVPTDVSSAEQVDHLAAATLERFGRVDVICNNAGVSTVGPPMWETPRKDWDWVLGVNLGGVFNGVQAFVPHLVAQGSGHVVNTASMAGLITSSRQAPYTASKHAVVALSESLAVELATIAPGVGVTVVCPGLVTTNIFTSERNRPHTPDAGGFLMDDAAMTEIMGWASTLGGPEIGPAEAADLVLGAVEANRLHVAPNGLAAPVRARMERLLDDLESP